jgi:phospholipase/lecithinase/hemolysin
MATQWLRRGWLLAACASALVLAACGGGSIVSQLSPKRIVAFGDAMGDLGQNGAGRYTVNDGTLNNWTAFVASGFGVALTPTSAGGTSYAIGNARVTATTDAAGNTGTPSVEQQITTFLGTNPTPDENDLILLSAGTSDVIVQAQAALAGTQTRDQMVAATGQAGRELAAQVRRLTDRGFKHVVVVGPYNLGRSPWAVALNQAALLEAASSRFNDQLLVSLVDLGAKVLYVDAALQFNLYTANPGSYDLKNASTPVCTSVDSGAGIGTGAGQVNSRLCTISTLAAGNYAEFLFADRVYPTPRGHQLFGDYALSRIKERW